MSRRGLRPKLAGWLLVLGATGLCAQVPLPTPARPPTVAFPPITHALLPPVPSGLPGPLWPPSPMASAVVPPHPGLPANPFPLTLPPPLLPQNPLAALSALQNNNNAQTLSAWLTRLHQAPRKRSYAGTYVVWSAAGTLSSARIWHVCDGEQQLERVDLLTGQARSTFRRDTEVVTFLPERRVVRSEQRESLGLFPQLLSTGDAALADFYQLTVLGRDRVAGVQTEVVLLQPRDAWRYGYRVWSEHSSGLVVKLQTLGNDGRVLEQAAFSELQLDAPVPLQRLVQMMNDTRGYTLEKTALQKTTVQHEGWQLRQGVPGFRPLFCYRRGAARPSTHCVYSDGLASVSLFIEDFDAQRHTQPSQQVAGATHGLSQRLLERWWLTALGEVPTATLKAFAQGLERLP